VESTAIWLWNSGAKDKDLSGCVRPQFFTRSGEEIELPPGFADAVTAVTSGVTCLNCLHPHYSRLVAPAVTSPIVLPDWKHSLATGSSGSTGSEGECAAASPGISSEEVG
jgi:hypothetical protein